MTDDIALSEAERGAGIVRCDACPVLCRIRPGRAGACDRYANEDGKLVRVDPLVLLAKPDLARVAFVEGSAAWRLSDRIGLAICWALGLLFCAIAVAIVVYLMVQGLQYLKLSMLFTPATAGFSQSQSGGFSDALLGTLIVAFATGSAMAYDRHVHIHNESSVTMNGFYASNVGVSNYEENILRGDVIRAGESWDINIDDGSGYCKYDFLADFADGSEAKKDNVNVCEVSDFYFND